MQWFKHDTDSSIDGKIKKLILKYGTDGYAIYFHCLELIAGNITENNITFELEHDSEIIADNLKVKSRKNDLSDIDYVQEIMKYMVEIGLFEQNNGHIYCYKLLKRLDSSMTSSIKMRNIIQSAKQNHDTVMIQSCSNHDTVMQEENRKEENRLDKNNIFMSSKELDHTDANEIINHLNESTSSKYRLTDKHRSLINARLKDYSKDDIIKVIDYKSKEWLNNTKMSMYLRPETLFNATKFESYYNQAIKTKGIARNEKDYEVVL